MPKPNDARRKKLDEWLDRHNARLMWQESVPNIGRVQCYFVFGQILLVLLYDHQDGAWDMFIQPALSAKSGATLNEAEETLRYRLEAMQSEGTVT